MQEFIPVTDEMLQGRARVEGSLVPFDPEYLRPRESVRREGVMPANWLSDNDYAAACRRLAESKS